MTLGPNRSCFTGNICPLGSYCPENSGAPRECPAGTYMNTTGNEAESTCLECDPGTYCEGTGNEEPTGTISVTRFDISDRDG